MDTGVISALSGVLGSLVGGSATVATAWITQRTLTRRELEIRDVRQREKLYAEFISECAKLLLDAFTHTLETPDQLLGLYALTNRIRLTASQPVLREAEQLLSRITDQYFSRNLTVEEMHELARSSRADPLLGFGEACRAELKSIRARL